MDSEEEKEQTKAFKVEDRRRFSAEGELKPEHRSPEPAVNQASSVESTIEAAASLTSGDTQTQAQQTQSYGPSSAHREAAPEITFGTFIVGLSTQALVHLGELPDPHSNQRGQDLIAAEQLIDIIAMLENKTRGNLEPDEQTMLQTILFELRMKYVERARR
jgi:Domain of unknown function (DUF1844)